MDTTVLTDVYNSIVTNLTKVGIGVLIFLLSYLSNMCFSIWYNTHLLGQEFDIYKILNGFLKVIIIGVGIVLFTLSITLIIPFAEESGLTIPAEYLDVVEVVTTLVVCLTATLKYIKEAWGKFYKILNGDKTS